MARLYEYQGKQLLSEAGIAIPAGSVASTPEEAGVIAQTIGRGVAVKAQVWTTGRFKAGAIKFADSAEAAKIHAGELLGGTVKGFRVETVLVEERLEIEKEFYIGVIVDSSHRIRAPVVIFSSEGGVEVESVASARISRSVVNILSGLDMQEARNLISTVGVADHLLDPLSQVVVALYGLFRRYDARSAEINPLVLTKEGRIVAADCRISIDDASVARHAELGIAVPRESDTPPTELDKIAWKIEESDYRGISFFAQLAQDTSKASYIGYHAIGGGGALLAADTLVRHGLKLANYAETSGNPTAGKVYRTAKVILSQPGLASYCLMGAVIASQDQWHHSHGLVKAFREMLTCRPGFPVLVLIAGNKEEEALNILREGLADLPIRLEVYGREYIHRLSFLAERMKVLTGEYEEERHKSRHFHSRSIVADHGTRYDFRTGFVLIDEDRCVNCASFACVKACNLYGGYLFRVHKGRRVLGIPLDAVARMCTECLACEYECRVRGQGALTITIGDALSEDWVASLCCRPGQIDPTLPQTAT